MMVFSNFGGLDHSAASTVSRRLKSRRISQRLISTIWNHFILEVLPDQGFIDTLRGSRGSTNVIRVDLCDVHASGIYKLEKPPILSGVLLFRLRKHCRRYAIAAKQTRFSLDELFILLRLAHVHWMDIKFPAT